MAEFVLSDASVTINSVDLSDHVRAVTIKADRDIFDTTAMGDATKTRICGLKDWSFDVEFNQDFEANKVDATLWPIWDGGLSVPVAIRPTSAAKGATNPEFTGNAVLPSYSPIDGSVGSGATVKVSFSANSDLIRSV